MVQDSFDIQYNRIKIKIRLRGFQRSNADLFFATGSDPGPSSLHNWIRIRFPPAVSDPDLGFLEFLGSLLYICIF